MHCEVSSSSGENWLIVPTRLSSNTLRLLWILPTLVLALANELGRCAPQFDCRFLREVETSCQMYGLTSLDATMGLISKVNRGQMPSRFGCKT